MQLAKGHFSMSEATKTPGGGGLVNADTGDSGWASPASMLLFWAMQTVVYLFKARKARLRTALSRMRDTTLGVILAPSCKSIQ